MSTSRVSLSAVVTFSLVSLLVGCSGKTAEQSTPESPSASSASELEPDQSTSEEGHSHGAGPHDGTLADWGGGKFHVEFTVDHDKQECTVYILGDDEKTPSPINAEEILLSIKDPAIQVSLKATPQDGNPEGSSSRFVGNHESLGVVQEYEGTITGVVDDTPYSGNFHEEPHEHQE